MAANWRRHSNLQSFLSSTTPSVPTHSLHKSCFQDLNTLWQPATVKDTVEYFSLGDLWDRYYEWSAYGAGAPICLHNGDTVVQYYVPSLSAIQIYTSKGLTASRDGVEDSESECWSDDSESEKLSRSWDAASEDSSLDHEGSWSGKERFGHLYFQFFENCSPYGRIPLVDKVYELARNYPGLTSFKSVELSPASWMAVAWKPKHLSGEHYKIYLAKLQWLFVITFGFGIPSVHHLQNILCDQKIGLNCSLDHTSEAMQNDVCCGLAGRNGSKSKEITDCISLEPFGLATYKMQGCLWINPESLDQENIVSLYSAADSWLKQLRVQHHDFTFFSSHSM